MDKDKVAEQGGREPFNRIRRALGAEMAALGPADRVLILGTTAAPHACKRKDEEALLACFGTQIHVPLPDYASRQARLPYRAFPVNHVSHTCPFIHLPGPCTAGSQYYIVSDKHSGHSAVSHVMSWPRSGDWF